MTPFTQTNCFRLFIVGLLALAPFYAQAETGDVATLQSQVDSYLSATNQSEVDGLLSEYTALNYGTTYSSDSPKLGKDDSEGNADSTWTKMTYTAQTASQLIGYASDQCAAHTAYDQLVAKGIKIDQAKFNSMRDKFCKLVNAAAELKHRYDKYQQIKQKGVVLAKRSKSQEHDFNGHHRTFGGGFSLMYFPDIADTVQNGLSADQKFQYNSWMKWSDDQPLNLNILKRIREMRNSSADSCDGFSFHVIDGGSVDGYLYMDVENVTSKKLTIKNCMKAVYNGTHKTHGFPSVTMEAPFGYLYELEQMKDGAKAKLVDKVKTKVSSMIGANQQMINLIKNIKS